MAKRKLTSPQFSSPACLMHEFATAPGEDSGCEIGIKRIYDKPARTDGYRVLVDRLWPRGITKEAAALDAWERDVAPSTALRKWFAHKPEHWSDFKWKYRLELIEHAALVKALHERAVKGRVTLLYAAHDPKINHAVVLAEAIRDA